MSGILTITGVFYTWQRVDYGNIHVYEGRIIGDSKGRFPDGRLIRTSKVIKEMATLTGTLVWTHTGSIYFLKEKEDDYRPNSKLAKKGN